MKYTSVFVIILILLVFFINYNYNIEPFENQVYDFVIIGAGVSGAYCAHRLQKLYPNKSILVIEKTSHIGGRLQSFELENSDVQAEHGGMRFFPKVQPKIAKLVKEFNIPTIKVDYVNNNNLLYLNGKRMRVKDFYYANNKTPTQLIDEAIDTELKSKNLTWQTVEQNKEISNQNIKMIISKYFPYDVLTQYSKNIGYNFMLGDISAATFIKEHQALAAREDSPQYMIPTGYKTIPEELLKNFNNILFNSLVTQLVPIGEHVKVKYQTISPTSITNHYVEKDKRIGDVKSVIAKKVICTALPIDALNLYQWTPKIKNIFHNSLYHYIATKIFIQFKNNWWKQLGLTSGKSMTDLPLRQVWYWNDNTLQIYNDMNDALYWVPYLDKSKPYPYWSSTNDVPDLVKEVKKQLSIMHGIPESEMEITKISWQHWNVGACFFKPTNIKEVQDELVEPVKNIYLANSCYSGFQGFVEGSLDYTDRVLDKI
jgi:monoamine oxidase